jgi:hypothetical protein
MARPALRIVLVVLIGFVAGGCGRSVDDTEPSALQAGVDRIFDAFEVARAELREDKPVTAVIATPKGLRIVAAEFGRKATYSFNLDGDLTNVSRSKAHLNPALTYPLAEVPPDAPGIILADILDREKGTVDGFEAVAARAPNGVLRWTANVDVDGKKKVYIAELDGSLVRPAPA